MGPVRAAVDRLRGRLGPIRRSARILGRRYTFRLYASRLLHPDSHAYDEPFDERLSIDTSGAWDYGPGNTPSGLEGTIEGYEGTRIDVVRHAFDRLPIDRSTAELWDLGSGKGRVTILAAESGFVRVVGVELNEALHRTAETNVAAAARRTALAPIELRCGSATELELPAGPVVVFMFNPFSGAVFDAVVERIEERARRSEAPLLVIYVNPRQHERLDDSPHFELFDEQPLDTWWWSTNIYRAR